MSINSIQLWLALAIAGILGGSLAYVFWLQRKAVQKGPSPKSDATSPSIPSRSLQLQAYERLVLLADRIALPNLINRLGQSDIPLKEMQLILIQNIRQEFEHNITQQIYVSAAAWDAVRNLKDQNLLIINQVASYLSPESNGQDLNKAILQMLVENPKASLHGVVSEVLSYEAKKLLP
jgi:parvulin-like peptidyl-prolyl isomerase